MGGGGHSKKILEVLGPDGILIGLDQDPHALEESSRVFQSNANVRLVHANFSDLENVLKDQGIKEVNGCLFDLGVSSRQLESISRGFSFRADAQLDMRMNVHSECTAYDLVNRLSVKELGRIFWEYGDERWANRLARRIGEQRQKKPIRTTLELARIAEECIPGVKRKRTLHPATKMFMALRIAVNRELESLNEGLRAAVRVTSEGGRVVVISYHSLEDRLVKGHFRELSRCKESEIPGTEQVYPQKIVSVLTKKPLTPSQEEVRANPRARSAKLRAVQVEILRR
jgi:16S rRNA (cytosine1402-N4)-methyltransferase